jgi:hypothetical protein
MLIFPYESKKVLKECVGQRLRYTETSAFGDEYKSTGELTGANRPSITKMGREFFANVTMENDIIVKVK